MNKFINAYDEMGNFLFDKFVIPLSKGSKNILIDNNEIIKSFLTFKTAFMENKLSQYLEFINQNKNEEIIDFIENLNNEEKVFFVETINKVIELDDSLQIYIMAYLTKQFKENKELNYYEKQLFYNINMFSEDDFKIFYCIYNKQITGYRNYINVDFYYKNEEIITISLNKFVSIGLLKLTTNFKDRDKEDITSYENYNLTSYSKKLYECLNSYFQETYCDEILEKKTNTTFVSKIKFY